MSSVLLWRVRKICYIVMRSVLYLMPPQQLLYSSPPSGALPSTVRKAARRAAL